MSSKRTKSSSKSGSQTICIGVTWERLRKPESLTPTSDLLNLDSGLEHRSADFSVKGQMVNISVSQAL